MKFLDRLERRFGRFAIPNLTFYLVGGQGLALLFSLGLPELASNMALIPSAVMDGQWWRLLSFLFTPPFGNPIFAIFALYLLWFMGNALEAQWGAFRYTLYVLLGMLTAIAAAFLFPFGVATNVYITGSIFLAFAWLYPEFQLLLFFILPVKIKWLAWLTWAGYAWGLITGDWMTRALIVASIGNFLAFFGGELYVSARYGHRKMKKQATAAVARDKPRHLCAVCGVTDLSDKTMEFRYCTKCDPPVQYCMTHLGDHQHRRDAPG